LVVDIAGGKEAEGVIQEEELKGRKYVYPCWNSAVSKHYNCN